MPIVLPQTYTSFLGSTLRFTVFSGSPKTVYFSSYTPLFFETKLFPLSKSIFIFWFVSVAKGFVLFSSTVTASFLFYIRPIWHLLFSYTLILLGKEFVNTLRRKITERKEQINIFLLRFCFLITLITSVIKNYFPFLN